MTQENQAEVATGKKPGLHNLLGRIHVQEWLLQNPIIAKELRGRMRGRRAFVTLTVYVMLIGLFVGLIYILLVSEGSYGSNWNPDTRQMVGKFVFGTVVLLQLLMASIVGPGLTAGAISSERERQTLDILRTTLLPARSLVLGKLIAAVAFMLLMMVAALPVESLALFLGGVEMGEMFASVVMLVVTALAVCTLGVFYSSLMKRTQGATVAAYVTIFSSYILLVLVFLFGVVADPSGNDLLPTLFLWLMLASNPLSAAITSEVFLVEDQSLFLVELPMPSSASYLPSQLSIPSPWIIYSVIHLALVALLLAISIRRLDRPDR